MKNPEDDKSNNHDLRHLCPSCDDLQDEIDALINPENYEDAFDYNIAVEELKDTARLCRECHKLDMYELD